MKKMKTLALLFLAVIISSTGLTSCIDEEIDPAVAAIYQNQALLLSSQASLNDAKATYQIALANLQDAYAAAALSAAADASAESAQDVLSQAAMTQIQVAAAAQSLSEDEEYLSLQIALNAIYLEEALAELEMAKLQWEIQMIALQASIDDAYVSLASDYFSSYMSAKNSAIIQEGLAMMKQSEIEVAQLLIQTAGNVTWEYYLAQQQDILTGLQADLASQEAAAATLASVIADPSTSASLSSELQVSLEENNAAYDALEVDMAVLQSELNPLMGAIMGMGALDQTYHDAEDDLDDVQEMVENIEEAIVSLEEDVAEAELALADNPTYLTGLQADIDTAEAAVVTAGVDGVAAVAAAVATGAANVADADAAADAAVVAAQTAADAAVAAAAVADAAADAAADVASAAVVTANAAVVTAADALIAKDARQAEWDAQENAVNDAASALVTATNAAAANDGAATELLVLTTEIAALASAVVEYDLARSLFDADPTGTTYTQDYAGDDGELGDHSDMFPDSFREVFNVVTFPQFLAADVLFTGPVYSDGSIAPVVGNLTTNSWGLMVTGGGTDEGNYWNVELDDLTAPSNIDRFTTATTKKLDADAILETAQADYDTALAAEGVVDQNLVDANTEYNAQVAIFEDNGAAIVLAQGVLDVADAAVVTADAAVVTADAAVVTAGTTGVAAVDAAVDAADAAVVAAETAADAAVDAAETAVEVAEDALADALICDADCLQQVIDDIEHELLKEKTSLAEMQAVLTEYQAQFDAAQAALEDLLLTVGADVTEIFAMINELQSMQAQLDALDMEYNMISLVLNAINFDNADLQETLDDMLMGISASNDAIESQEVLIALGSIDEAAAQSVITQLQNELVVIEDQILAYNTLAAEYWDLMLAALAG
jgi:hypothetical protein